MVDEPTTVEKLHKLPWAIAFNASLAVFVQLTFFGSVFVLFLNELGLSTSQIGFVLSLLPFAGLLALVVAPAVARFPPLLRPRPTYPPAPAANFFAIFSNTAKIGAAHSRNSTDRPAALAVQACVSALAIAVQQAARSLFKRSVGSRR